jgi:PAS domain S-box-containing protein
MDRNPSPETEHKLDTCLTRLLHSNVIGIVRCDVFGNVFDANDAYLEIIGYSRADMIAGLRLDEITPPEHSPVDEPAVVQLKETGHAPPFQKEYLHKDGHRVPVTIGVTALDDQGLHCLAYVIDHSEHREVQKRLADSVQQFRFLAETIPQLVWSAARGGKTYCANHLYIDFTGVDPADEDGFAWKEFIHPDDLPMIVEVADIAFARDDPMEGEARFRTKEGDYRWQLIRGVKMPMVDRSMRWFGIWTDIDDPKRIEGALREAVARFRTLAEAIPQIVWAAKPDGAINFFNHRWFEYTGLSLEQSLDGRWKLLIHPDDLDEYLSGWQKALETGDTFECEFRLKRTVGVRALGGGYRKQLCRAVAVQSSTGSIIEWCGTWTDIQEQR